MVTQAVENARASVLQRVDSARSSISELTVFTKDIVLSVRADLQEKGLRTWAGEAALSAKQLAGEGVEAVRRRTAEATQQAGAKAVEMRTAAGEIVAQDSFKATAAGAAAGAVVVTPLGAATGTVTGGFLGAAIGLLAAPLTFGLSIPIGAVVGGGAGFATGVAAGGSVGVVGGGAAGYGIYTKRDNIKSLAQHTGDHLRGGTERLRGAVAAAGSRLPWHRAGVSPVSAPLAALQTDATLLGHHELQHPLKEMARTCIQAEALAPPPASDSEVNA